MINDNAHDKRTEQKNVFGGQDNTYRIRAAIMEMAQKWQSFVASKLVLLYICSFFRAKMKLNVIYRCTKAPNTIGIFTRFAVYVPITDGVSTVRIIRQLTIRLLLGLSEQQLLYCNRIQNY